MIESLLSLSSHEGLRFSQIFLFPERIAWEVAFGFFVIPLLEDKGTGRRDWLRTHGQFACNGSHSHATYESKMTAF
jgi:hypothetical protein